MSASSAVTMNTNMPNARIHTRSAVASLDISMNTYVSPAKPRKRIAADSRASGMNTGAVARQAIATAASVDSSEREQAHLDAGPQLEQQALVLHEVEPRDADLHRRRQRARAAQRPQHEGRGRLRPRPSPAASARARA